MWTTSALSRCRCTLRNRRDLRPAADYQFNAAIVPGSLARQPPIAERKTSVHGLRCARFGGRLGGMIKARARTAAPACRSKAQRHDYLMSLVGHPSDGGGCSVGRWLLGGAAIIND